MEGRVVLLLCLSVYGVAGKGKVEHAELRGEHPNQEDVDNGQCIPMPCTLGEPPKECKRLCDTRGYETVCQPPADFCLCRHSVHGKLTLVSPDEVMEQAPDSAEIAANAEKTTDSLGPTGAQDSSKPEEPEEGFMSLQVFAVLVPLKNFLYETVNEKDSPEPAESAKSLGYQPVNIHEGRLFWDFRYILTGLLLLMVGLVVYELILCASQVYRPKNDNFFVKCDPPEVKVCPITLEKEKILNV